MPPADPVHVPATDGPEFVDLTGSVNFNLRPEAAIGFLRAKGLRTSRHWTDLAAEEHQKAFTVAKLADLDLLSLVHEEAGKAIEDGITRDMFRERLTPILQRAGWWGKQLDPETGALVQLGSAARIDTIFRTNLQVAYATGAWEKIQEQAAEAPFLMYDAIDDHRTRPSHAALDGKVLRVDDPKWRTIAPPNGHNCRCSLVQLDQGELESLTGKTKPDRLSRGVVEGAPDKGWAHNPGAAGIERASEIIRDRVAKMPQAIREAARERLQIIERAAKSVIAGARGAADRQALRRGAAEALPAPAITPEGMAATIANMDASQTLAAETARDALRALAIRTIDDSGGLLFAALSDLVGRGLLRPETPAVDAWAMVRRRAVELAREMEG